MKFTVVDLNDVPEFGLAALVEAAKSLPLGKGLRIPTGEVPYDKEQLAANVSRLSGRSFRLKEIDGHCYLHSSDEVPQPKPKAMTNGSGKVAPGVLLRSLRQYGSCYSKAIFDMLRNTPSVGIYANAFSSQSAKNSFAAYAREHGYVTSKGKKGRAKVLIVSRSGEPVKVQKKPYSTTKSWKDKAGKSWIQKKGLEEVFKSAWFDPKLDTKEIGKRVGCSDSWCHVIARALGLPGRHSFRGYYTKTQRQLRGELGEGGQSPLPVS